MRGLRQGSGKGIEKQGRPSAPSTFASKPGPFRSNRFSHPPEGRRSSSHNTSQKRLSNTHTKESCPAGASIALVSALTASPIPSPSPFRRLSSQAFFSLISFRAREFEQVFPSPPLYPTASPLSGDTIYHHPTISTHNLPASLPVTQPSPGVATHPPASPTIQQGLQPSRTIASHPSASPNITSAGIANHPTAVSITSSTARRRRPPAS